MIVTKMEFFYSDIDQTIDINQIDGTVYQLHFKKSDLTPKTIYVSTGACYITFKMMLKGNPHLHRLANDNNRTQIFNHPQFPKIINSHYDKMLNEFEYTHEKFIPHNEFKPYIPSKSNEKVLVINGMGTGLGDGIIGIQALRIFEDRFKTRPVMGIVSLVAERDHKQLYESNGYEYFFLPLTLEEILKYDAVIDLSALSIKVEFNTINLVDFFLRNCGIDSNLVTHKEKHNQLQRSKPLLTCFEELFSNLKGKNKKIIGLKTTSSSSIRSLDNNQVTRCIRDILLQDPNNHVLLFTNEVKFNNVDILTKKDKKRITLIQHTDFNQLVNVISRLDQLITVDTCFYHITNAFDIPTLVLFTTIDPDLRLNYYDNCIGVDLRTEKLKGKHYSFDPIENKYHYESLKTFRLKKYLNQLVTIPRKDLT